MTIERRTVVSQIEITSDNTVQIRMALQLVDGGEVISSRWHRTSIPTGVLAADQMAVVNEHLASMGEAPVSGSDIARVEAFHVLAIQYATQE